MSFGPNMGSGDLPDRILPRSTGVSVRAPFCSFVRIMRAPLLPAVRVRPSLKAIAWSTDILSFVFNEDERKDIGAPSDRLERRPHTHSRQERRTHYPHERTKRSTHGDTRRPWQDPVRQVPRSHVGTEGHFVRAGQRRANHICARLGSGGSNARGTLDLPLVAHMKEQDKAELYSRSQ